METSTQADTFLREDQCKKVTDVDTPLCITALDYALNTGIMEGSLYLERKCRSFIFPKMRSAHSNETWY